MELLGLGGFLYVIAIILDIVFLSKSSEYRKQKKLKKKNRKGNKNEVNELFEPVEGKLAWFIFLIITGAIILSASFWIWLGVM